MPKDSCPSVWTITDSFGPFRFPRQATVSTSIALLGLRRAGPVLTAHLVGSAALSYAATSQAFPSSHTDEDFVIKYNIQNGGSAPEQVTNQINIAADCE